MYVDARNPRDVFLTMGECERLLILLRKDGEDGSTLARKIDRARRSYFNNGNNLRRDK